MPVKLKGKQWFSIISPKLFGEQEVAKTIANSPDGLVGRTINLSAVELTDDINKYFLTLKLKITSVNGDKASTQFSGSEILQDYLSRMVLRRIRRLDAVQDLTTSDNVKIRVKSLVIVSKKTKSSVALKIKEFVEQAMKKHVESITLDEFLQSMLSNEIKSKVMREGRVIYPIRNFEIRKTEILSNKAS
ncbi:MAG: hypothetical protein HYW23_03795 [Candidatus Aenigmarchaeota archaeon]|nr:hypothetical protein [Candidatus Aenigmarchaeota archaeon]